MMSWSRFVWVLVGLILLMAVLTIATTFYRNHWHEEKQPTEQAREKAEVLQQSIEKIQRQQQAVAEIDKHYTPELAKANEELERLGADLATGGKRLYLKAERPKLPEATTTPSVDNATRARLGSDAEQNYLRLRQQVTQRQKQLEVLQE